MNESTKLDFSAADEVDEAVIMPYDVPRAQQ
jgi:hypothetical protein